MEHKPVFKSMELSPGAFVQTHSTLPSILKNDRSERSADVVTDGALTEGDIIYEVYTDKKFVVDKVVATRKAKGDWSGKTHEGTKPTWSKIKYRL